MNNSLNHLERSNRMNSNSFLIIARYLLDNKKKYRHYLDNDCIVTYMYLCDRIKVSQKNHWIDHSNNQVFCYYDTDKLCKDAKVGRTKYFKIRKILHALGLMNWQKDKSGSWRIYLPKFIWRTPKSSKSERYSNNKSSNNKNIDNTVFNTPRTHVRDKPTDKHSEDSKRDINSWIQAVTLRGGIDKECAIQIARIANKDIHQANHIYKSISKERSRIAKASGLATKHNKITFEAINKMYPDGFKNKLTTLNAYIHDPSYKKAKPTYYMGYLVNSIRRFFIHLFIWEKQQLNKPKIPIFKL